MSKEYVLPYVYDERGRKEYVLLTPSDILREDEPAINRKDFYNSYERIRTVIEDDELRAYVNNYIGLAVKGMKKVNEKNTKSK